MTDTRTSATYTSHWRQIELAASHLNGAERWCDICGGTVFPEPSKHLSTCPFTSLRSKKDALVERNAIIEECRQAAYKKMRHGMTCHDILKAINDLKTPAPQAQVNGRDGSDATAQAPYKVARPSNAAIEPREVLLGESLLEYTTRNFNELCSAWSDVRNVDGELDIAKCEYATAKERIVRSAIHELATPSFTMGNPVGYAVRMADGPFVGIWQSQEVAESICRKQPYSHHDVVIPVYADPQAPVEAHPPCTGANEPAAAEPSTKCSVCGGLGGRLKDVWKRNQCTGSGGQFVREFAKCEHCKGSGIEPLAGPSNAGPQSGAVGAAIAEPLCSICGEYHWPVEPHAAPQGTDGASPGTRDKAGHSVSHPAASAPSASACSPADPEGPEPTPLSAEEQFQMDMDTVRAFLPDGYEIVKSAPSSSESGERFLNENDYRERILALESELAECERALSEAKRIQGDQFMRAERAEAARSAIEALHASAPEGYKCADCTMDREPCPQCYEAWWKKRHPNTIMVAATDSGAKHG